MLSSIVNRSTRVFMNHGVSRRSLNITKEIMEMDAASLKNIIDSADRPKYQIIDVREDHELQAASLPDKNVIHLPLSQSDVWARDIMIGKFDRLDANLPTVCVCQGGVRSHKVASFLAREADFSEVYNLTGGISAYSKLPDNKLIMN